MDQPENKTTDRRVKKTKNAIYSAFQKLLSEKKYSEITVKELTEEADITRKTFYLHYGALEDVLREYLSDLLQSIHDELETSDLDEEADYAELFYVLSRGFGEERVKMAGLMEDKNSRQIVYQLLMEQQKKRWKTNELRYGLSEQEAMLFGTFTTYGILAMYMRWYTDSDVMPLEEFTEMSQEIMAGVNDLMKKWGNRTLE